jgi:hypothetical protein
VEELISEFTSKGSAAGFVSCMIAILYFLTIYSLEIIGSSTVWTAAFRGLLADYAYVVCRALIRPAATQVHLQIFSFPFIDRHHFLGGIFAHPWPSQSSGYDPCPYQQSLLPNAAARLADSLLGTGR